MFCLAQNPHDERARSTYAYFVSERPTSPASREVSDPSTWSGSERQDRSRIPDRRSALPTAKV